MWKKRNRKAVIIFFLCEFRKRRISYLGFLLFGDVGGVWWLTVLDELIGQAASKPTRWYGMHQRAVRTTSLWDHRNKNKRRWRLAEVCSRDIVWRGEAMIVSHLLSSFADSYFLTLSQRTAIQLLTTPEYFRFAWTPLLRERDKITSLVARHTITTKTYSWRKHTW
jgi:hypothetical protein